MTAPQREPLPVDLVLSRVCAAARERRGFVLVAPTGSGKTTRVPPALLDELPRGEVWLVEPRRIAARAAARRIAAERGVALGAEVGYAVRHERVGGRHTRLWVVTEGVLLARLVEDPLLEGVACVLFDEFHERRLDADVALALCRRSREEVRGDLVIGALSATLDAAPLAAFLDAPIVESEGRRFPVDVAHVPGPVHESLEDAVARAVARELSVPDRGDFDVLVFLPGVGEIRRVARRLDALARDAGIRVFELYGEMDAAAQDRVFEREGGVRVVLATNVAETSLTLPRIGAVVDAGLARVLRHDPATGLDRLVLAPISRASAEQRAGRAGREAPGRAWRLWSEPEHRSRAERDAPEVSSLDVSGAVLALVAFGESDPAAFPWFEPPPTSALRAAIELLLRLDAVRRGGAGLSLTPIGAGLARLPLSPRLGRLLLAGADEGVVREAALAAALLAERDPFRRSARERGADPFADASDSDLFERVRALDGGGRAPHGADPAAVQAVRRVAERLERSVRARGRAAPADRPDALARALLAAYPDRVARRREAGSRRARLVGGKGVELAPHCRVTEAELFVAIEVEGSKGGNADARVHQAAAIDAAWLRPDLVHERDEVAFDPVRRRVTAFRRRLYIDLPLDERAVPPEPVAARELLLAEARKDPAAAYALGRDAVRALRARIAFLAAHCPELALPHFDDHAIAAALEEHVAPGTTSFDALAELPVVDVLLASLDPAQRSALEREAPAAWTTPSGRRIALDYAPGRPPYVAARIQELFGLASTPRIARGRVALVVHLLAPSGRPQQVTDDLASFWSTTYPLVRRELARRYPRHPWPDDPTRADPTSRPLPRPR